LHVEKRTRLAGSAALVSLAVAPLAFAQSDADTLPPLPPPANEPTTAVPSPAVVPAPTEVTPAPAVSAVPSAKTPQLPAASEQRPTAKHDGLYLRASLGFGYIGVWGDGPLGAASVSGAGSSFGLALGGSIVSGLPIAATVRVTGVTARFVGGPSAISTVNAANPDADTGFVELGVLMDWYPLPKGGWHGGGAIAFGDVIVTPHATGADMTSGGSFAGSLFGGYDWLIGGKISLGLMLVASTAGAAEMRDGNGSDSGYSLQPFAIALEGSFLVY
jgi:hypothetical protein